MRIIFAAHDREKILPKILILKQRSFYKNISTVALFLEKKIRKQRKFLNKNFEEILKKF